jgi:hypothetical protein
MGRGRWSVSVIGLIAVVVFGLLLGLPAQAEASSLKPFQLTHNDWEDSEPAIGGGFLTWHAWDGNDWEVMLLDLSKGVTTQLTSKGFGCQDLAPAVDPSGGYVVYGSTEGSDPAATSIKLYNTRTGSTRTVGVADVTNLDSRPRGWRPLVAGEWVVWQGYGDDRPYDDDLFAPANVYLYSIDSGVTQRLAEGSWSALSESYVVWADPHQDQLWVYELATGIARSISCQGLHSGVWAWPVLSGDFLLVSTLDSRGDDSLCLYDLTSMDCRDLPVARRLLRQPALGEDRAAWVDEQGLWTMGFDDAEPLCVTSSPDGNWSGGEQLVVNENGVAWSYQTSSGKGWQVFYYDCASHATTCLSDEISRGFNQNPRLWGSTVVWQGMDATDPELFMANASGFPDVSGGYPYAAAIADLASRGVIQGFAEDGTFRPGAAVTRQQFAKMVVLAGGYPVSSGDRCPFTDVATQMGSDPLYPSHYVGAAADHGITVGKTVTRFDPYADISRLQVITMIVRAANDLEPGLLSVPPAGLGTWLGDPTHGASAARAEYNGLLEGLDLNALDPYGYMSRGEVAQVLHNLLTTLSTGPIKRGVAPEITSLAKVISSEMRGREIALPRALPAGWRLATDSEVQALGVDVYLPGMPASSNPEMFPIFHAQGRHADSGYAAFFTRDGNHVLVFKVDELEDVPVPRGAGTGVYLQGAEWTLSRNGAGLLWATDESNIEIYSEPAGTESTDVLLEFARAVQGVPAPFYNLTFEALIGLVHHYSGFRDDISVEGQLIVGEWSAALLTGPTRGFAVFKWEGWGWTLVGLARDDEPTSLFLLGDLTLQGVPGEVIGWANQEGFLQAR